MPCTCAATLTTKQLLVWDGIRGHQPGGPRLLSLHGALPHLAAGGPHTACDAAHVYEGAPTMAKGTLWCSTPQISRPQWPALVAWSTACMLSGGPHL